MATVGYIRTGPEGVATPAHYCDQDLRVEAKGLEPSNLLTASQALYQLSYAPVARRSLLEAISIDSSIPEVIGPR